MLRALPLRRDGQQGMDAMGVLGRIGRSPLLWGLLAALALWLCGPPSVAQSDAVRDWLEARDCVEHQLCATRGAPTSVQGLYDGALWLHILALAQRAGLTPDLLDALVALCEGLAVALVATAARRSDREGAAAGSALTAALWALAGIAATTGSTRMWAPALVVWLSALLLRVLVHLRDDAPRPLQQVLPGVVMGGLCGLLLDAHPMTAPAVLGAVTAASALAPWQGPLLVGVAAATAAGLAPGTLEANRPWLDGHLHWLAGAAAAAWLLGAGLFALQRRRPPLRALLPSLPAAVSLAAAAALPLLGLPLAPRYLLPAVAGVAWLAGVALGGHRMGGTVVRRWGPIVAGLAAALVLTAMPRRLPEPLVPWRVVPQLASAAEVRGLHWPGLIARVQAGEAGTLSAALQAFLPDRPLTRAGATALQVLWAPDRPPPAGWEVLAKRPGRQLLWRSRGAWVRPEAGTVCVEAAGKDGTCKPVVLGVQPSADGQGATPPTVTWGQRAYPRYSPASIADEGRWRFYLPVVIPGVSAPRTLHLLTPERTDGCGWQIASVDDEPLPKPVRSLPLVPSGVQRQRWVEVRRSVGGKCGPDTAHGMPADFVELEEAEAWLLER